MGGRGGGEGGGGARKRRRSMRGAKRRCAQRAVARPRFRITWDLVLRPYAARAPVQLRLEVGAVQQALQALDALLRGKSCDLWAASAPKAVWAAATRSKAPTLRVLALSLHSASRTAAISVSDILIWPQHGRSRAQRAAELSIVTVSKRHWAAVAAGGALG